MIPIIDFSLHQFKIVTVNSAKIIDFVNAAEGQHNGNLFVFHDPKYKYSALVIPNIVTEVIERLLQTGPIKLDSSAIETGLPDILKQGQMTVNEEQPAQNVAQLTTLFDLQAVTVVDNNQTPVGLFIPSVVVRRLGNSRPYRDGSSDLKQNVDKYVKNDDLVGAIKAFDTEFQHIHSESLNFHPSDPYVCSGSAGRHLVSKCPCKKHPLGPCGISNVAQY